MLLLQLRDMADKDLDLFEGRGPSGQHLPTSQGCKGNFHHEEAREVLVKGLNWKTVSEAVDIMVKMINVIFQPPKITGCVKSAAINRQGSAELLRRIID